MATTRRTTRTSSQQTQSIPPEFGGTQSTTPEIQRQQSIPNRRGGGSSDPVKPEDEPTQSFLDQPIIIKPSQEELNKQRLDAIKRQREQNLKQNRGEFFGLTDSDRIFAKGQEAKKLREEARSRGINISTRAREMQFLDLKEGESQRGEEVMSRLSLSQGNQGKPSQIGLVPQQSTLPYERSLIDRAKGVFKKIEDKLPSDEKGLIHFLKLDTKPRSSSPSLETDTTIIDVGVSPTGQQGTITMNSRAKTFFEKNGLNPKDNDAIDLKNQIDSIQDNFNRGSVNEEQANTLIEKNIDNYTKKQIVKGVPENVAVGFGLGLIQATPFALPINFLLSADLFLKRKKTLEQFKKFPKESAISTSAFLVGGLAGSRVFTKGNRAKIDINENNLESVTYLGGTEKNRVVQNALKVFPEMMALEKRNRITSNVAYKIKLNDGRSYDVLEYSKTVNGKIQKEFVGFESMGKDVFVGRGTGTIKDKQADLFTRAIKFQLAPNKFRSLLQNNQGRLIDVLERSKIVGQKNVRLGVTSVGVESRAGISRISEVGYLKSNGAKIRVLNQVKDVIRDVQKGGKLSPSKIRNVINITRRIQKEKPFSEAEFKRLNVMSLSQTEILSVLKSVRTYVEKINLGEMRTVGGRKLLETKSTFGGKTVTRGIKVGIEEKRMTTKSRTPLSKTFSITKEKSKSPAIIERGKQLLQLKPFQKLKTTTKTKINQEKPSPSISTASILATLPSRPQYKFFQDVQLGRMAYKLTPQIIQRDLEVIHNKINLINQSMTRLESISDSDFASLRIKQLMNQKELLKEKERELIKNKSNLKESSLVKVEESQKTLLGQRQMFKQVQKQQQRQKFLRKITFSPKPQIVRTPFKPRTPPPPLLTTSRDASREFKKKLPSPLGYNVGFYRKGKPIIKKVNLPFGRASKLGSKIATGSIAGSFFLKPSGKSTSLRDIKFKPSPMFRPSKRYKNVFVEKPRYRLDTPLEKRQIQMAKRNSLKTTKFIKLKRK